VKELLSRIEYPVNAVYNHTTKDGGTKCGGTADIGQEQNGGVVCGGRVYNEDLNTPKYKLEGSSVVSVTTDPKGEPSKFWNWAINGMKSCISSIQFGADNNVPVTKETLNDMQEQIDEFNNAVAQAKANEHTGEELDLDPDRFWRWSTFGLLSCLNFFRWGIESDVPIHKEHLDKVKAQYIRLGQYIEALEESIDADQDKISRKGEWEWHEKIKESYSDKQTV